MTFDDADLRSMLLARADRADALGLRRGAVEAARATPQLRPLLRRSSPVRSAWRMRVAAGIATVALVIGAIALAIGLRPPANGTQGAAVSTASATPAALPTPPAVDVKVTAPPYVAGSCPVTPVSVLAGGVTPEVVSGGIGWVWGPLPWQAKVGQKVGLEKTSPDQPYLDARVIIAERLPITPSDKQLSVRYPRGGGPGFIFGVGLPEPGCWLLTAVGPTVRSSVVVQAAFAPSIPPTDQNVPIVHSSLGLVSPCPTSPMGSSPARTWLDGQNRWQDPDPTAWLAAMKRKLVFSGVFADAAPFELVAAARVGIVGPADSQESAFVTEAPAFTTPVPGSQSKAMELILPTAGCWAITYLDPLQTSTIVVEIGG
jgi:hypothetical protein